MNSLTIGYAIFELLWMIYLFMLMFYLIPFLYTVGRSNFENNLQLFFSALTASTLIVILGMFISTMTKLIDPMSVKLLTLFFLIGIGYLHNKSKTNEDISLVKQGYLELLDLLDTDLSVKERINFVFSNVAISIKEIVSGIYLTIKTSPMLVLLNLITFGAAFFVRAYHAVTHYTLPASDTYSHLVWIKYINDNTLYPEGISPYGMHMIFSYMSTLFNVNVFQLVRFLGPLIGLIIIASIYSFVQLNFKGSKYAPWFAVSIYIFVSILPTAYWRQTTVLPQEFAMMFMLPVLSHLLFYIKNSNIRFVKLAAMGLAITCFTSVAVGTVTLLTVLMIILFNLKKIIKMLQLKEVFAYCFAAILMPIIPMGIYYLMGKPLNVSFVSELYRLIQWPYEMLKMPLQTLVANEEIPAILSVYVAVIAGLIFSKCAPFREGHNKFVVPSICVLILIALIGLNGINIPKSYQYEYEQAALGYNALLQEVPRGTMTLIAPQEQYQQILGYGYHYQLWRLMFEQTDLKTPKIEIPTKNIFVFVEKFPFKSLQGVNIKDASTAMPVISGDLTKYYSDYRNIIESKAYYWSEAFMKANPKQVSVFYEDEVFKIYWIVQDINAPINLKTGKPLEVFIK